MMVDLPFVVLVDVDKGIASLNLLASGTHGELINTHILTPILANGNMTIQNLALWLQLQKVDKIILDTRKVRPGRVTHSWQQNTTLGISCGNILGLAGGQGIVPKTKEGTDLILSNGFAHGYFLWHYGGVMMLDLPDAVFFDIVVGVAGLDFVAGGSHGELVDASIGCPSIANVDLPIDDLSLWLLEEEGVEVILDGGKVGTWLVRDGREEDWRLSVTTGHNPRITRGQRRIPKLEQCADLLLRNFPTDLGRRVEFLGLAPSGAEEIELSVARGSGGSGEDDFVEDIGLGYAGSGKGGVGCERGCLCCEGEGGGDGGELHC
mmetsp:Transcript_19716/g.42838  ORF Transcript_19716/g.42838 Transcript_19716/m.42838 type:complete len:321 (-) Transcript_19716:84-1046(-)